MGDSTQPPFEAVFVFGDSLSDNGAFTGFLPPINAVDENGDQVDLTGTGIFYNNRFTNGDVAADIAIGQLGIPGDSSTVYDDGAGTNFAVGGGTATDLSFANGTPLARPAISTLGDQVADFTTAAAFIPTDVLSNSAASILIGLNDLNLIGQLALLNPPAGELIDQSVIENGVGLVLEQIADQSANLAEAGVGTIILNTVPSGAFFPASNEAVTQINAVAGPGVGEALFDGVSQTVNDGIKGIAANLQGAGVNVQIIDNFSLANEIQADQETFGFLTLENALSGSSPGAPQQLLIDPDETPIDQVGFLDEVHFTTELHEVFGAFKALTLFNEQIDGDDGFDFILGGAGDQTIFANGGFDIVLAGSGDDLVFTGAGRDKGFGGRGDDVMFGGLDNDFLSGDRGDDVVAGGSGRDIVRGGFGDDVVAGNAGNDHLSGGFGRDLLIDGLGSDKAFGGAGNDIFLHRAADLLGGTNGADYDYFNGGWGRDTLLIVSEEGDDLDIGAYLAANNIHLRSVERIEVVTEAELETYFEGTALAEQAETADLFGLV